MAFLAVSSFQICLGGLLAFLVAFLGRRLGWLDITGALAAFGMGMIVFGLGGLAWSVVLLAFFVPSSLLSKLFKGRKIDSEKYAAKGSRRDSGQVLANGGVASFFVLLHLVFPATSLPWLGFVAAFAAANADTWATEIGVLSKSAPVLLTTGKRVARGTSGGISLVGTLGAAAGAAWVAGVGWLVWPRPFGVTSAWVLLLLFAAGLAGSFVDSWLGATVQRVNYCPACQKETEKFPLHTCGGPTQYVRGWLWLDNDRVNLFCTVSAALLALLVGGVFPVL